MSAVRVRHGLLASSGLAAALFVGAPGHAQNAESQVTREYVNAAAQSDQFERLEATTVLAQSQNPDIRAFANAMLAAHAETSRTLLQAVGQAGLNSPEPGISGDESAFLAALQSARGADFDRVYVKQQLLAHRAALATQQVYATAGDVPAIRAVATSTTSVIAAHLAMVDGLASKAGAD